MLQRIYSQLSLQKQIILPTPMPKMPTVYAYPDTFLRAMTHILKMHPSINADPLKEKSWKQRATQFHT